MEDWKHAAGALLYLVGGSLTVRSLDRLGWTTGRSDDFNDYVVPFIFALWPLLLLALILLAPLYVLGRTAVRVLTMVTRR